MKIKIDELRDLGIKLLTKNGIPEEDAKLIVDEYVDGELRERKCHGFSGIIKFGSQEASNVKGEWEIDKEADTYMLVNGNGNFGQVVCHKVLPKMTKKTKKHGISMLGIYNMTSYMMPGTFARIAAENDLIAFIFNYGGRARIAPTGSIDPIFGTNPIAVGIPTKESPIVLDMATSAIAMGKVRMALRLDEKLPDNVAIDKEGKSTVSPKDAMDGAILPFGGHKGYGLALMVEILSRCLMDVKKDKGEVYRGYFFMFVDPSKFLELDKFKENVEELKKEIKNTRNNGVYLPGEKSEKTKKSNLEKGYVEIDERIINDIKNLL